MCKGYAWTNGGQGVIEAIGTDNQIYNYYGTNGCPDKSADGMFEYAKSKKMEWGGMSTIPEIPGIAVRFPGHVGYYIGGGYVIEWRGFAYGCVKTKLSSRPWVNWYKLPFIDYDTQVFEAPTTSVPASTNDATKPTLRKGMKGEAVKELQVSLITLGYSCGSYGADGDFGNSTDSAVRAFQYDKKLEVDGIVGKATWAALLSAMVDTNKIEPAPSHQKVLINSGSWNIRTAPNYNSKVLGYAHGNDSYDLIETLDGWYLIQYGSEKAYIGQKAIKEVF